MKRIKKGLALILSFVMMLGLCSCAEKKDAVLSDEELEVTEYVLYGEKKPNAPDIYVIIKNLDSSYWKVMMGAAEDAANTLDCNVYLSGTHAETEWKNQEKLMQIAVERGADAIVLSPDDTVMLTQITEVVYDKGIPIVLTDTVVNTEKYDVCYMTDNLMAGQNAAAAMIEQVRNIGVSEDQTSYIAIQVGSVNSQTINERLAGFCQYWSQNAPKSWKIIDDVKSNQGDGEYAVQVANEFFSTYSNIVGVFGTNNGSTAGFAKVVIENQMKDVAVVGFDYSTEMATLINDREYHAATMVQQQYNMCYEGIASALGIIMDNEDYSQNKFIDTGVLTVKYETINDPEVKEIIERNKKNYQ